MKLDKERGDFLDKVLKHEYPKGMTQEELISNSGTLVLAGSETTATLLSAATYYLLRNPHTMAKLVAEVRGAFTNDADIDLVNTGQLTYLAAVLEDALRIYPPVPKGNQRVVPKGGDNVLGKWIPGEVNSDYIPSFKQFPSNRRLSNILLPDRHHRRTSCFLPLARQLPPTQIIHPRTFRR